MIILSMIIVAVLSLASVIYGGGLLWTSYRVDEQEELPPGWSVHESEFGRFYISSATGTTISLWDTLAEAVTAAWKHFGITREEYTIMRSAMRRDGAILLGAGLLFSIGWVVAYLRMLP